MTGVDEFDQPSDPSGSTAPCLDQLRRQNETVDEVKKQKKRLAVKKMKMLLFTV